MVRTTLTPHTTHKKKPQQRPICVHNNPWNTAVNLSAQFPGYDTIRDEWSQDARPADSWKMNQHLVCSLSLAIAQSYSLSPA